MKRKRYTVNKQKENLKDKCSMCREKRKKKQKEYAKMKFHFDQIFMCVKDKKYF